MKSTHGEIYKIKNSFKVKILKDLAKENSSELYTYYLQYVKGSFEYWSKKYVEDFCMADKKSQLFQIGKSIIHSLIDKIKSVVHSLPKDIKIEVWLQKFHDQLNATVVFSVSEIQDFIKANPEHSTTSNNIFLQEFLRALDTEEDKLVKMITHPDSKYAKITKWRNSPHLLSP